ncbi:MAG TPA: hypothetical protein VMN78_07035 [Longimicrobiales bacterium]|nr:hypothetical protein [Longimicrobiales bacterium]
MLESLGERLEYGLYQIVSFLPQLLAGLGILLLGYGVAKMVERGTEVFLTRIGFNRWMSDGGVTEALERTGTGFGASTVIAKLIFWAVMLLVILLIANVLGLNEVSGLFAELLSYIPSVIAAVIILLLGMVLGEFVKDLVLASAGAMHGGTTLARAAKGAVIVLAVFMALEQLNVAEDIVLVAFMAIMGAAALAAGIAFGLGGRKVAAKITEDWYARSREVRAGSSEAGPHARGAANHPAAAPHGSSPPGTAPAPDRSAPAESFGAGDPPPTDRRS